MAAGRRAGTKGVGIAAGLIACAFVGAACIVLVSRDGLHHHRGGVLLGKPRGAGGLWNKDYLFGTPGSDLTAEYEHGGSVLAERRREASEAVERQVKQLGRLRQQHVRAASKTQSLCGFGAGCESENTWIVKEAANLNSTAVNKDNFSKNRTVTDAVVTEVQKAMDDYDKEMDFEQEFRTGSPFNAFKGKQQTLRQVFPPGEGRHAVKTHKLCVQGAACEQWSDMQIHVAEQIDHDRVNENRPPAPSDKTMDEVAHAMEEQKLNPARTAQRVSVPLPPY
mmetsp:Transcript_36715/g.71673  ORF Transcript_36715/g.71673 Transcript_36715/m.71673 type:complete len:279 (+) Transcript_36715:21-857(+)